MDCKYDPLVGAPATASFESRFGALRLGLRAELRLILAPLRGELGLFVGGEEIKKSKKVSKILRGIKNLLYLHPQNGFSLVEQF